MLSRFDGFVPLARARGSMRELLEAVAAGELTPAAAEAELQGYVTDEAGRFDAARERRSGVPEAIFAPGKTADETASLAVAAVESTGRALVTRADERATNAIRDRVGELFPSAHVERDERARLVVVHTSDFEPPTLDAQVGVVTAGTADAAAAGEAAVVLCEMGVTVNRVDDVGVAGVHRLFDELETLRAQDALVVAAGREGALPTVVAGLVDVPVVGLPVSSGYGHGGEGRAALAGMLQSCAPILVVNVDAGYAAGVQVGLVARLVDSARTDGEA